MEPQDNKQLALRKAISAHEEAEAALRDLVKDHTDARYSDMLERIRRNVSDLNAEAASGDPADLV
ncbi:hypothetical protein BH23GEM5_BH23GEM5_20060 [soil metagenome]|jgi:hypothetical protein